jgi:phenylalanyl-tRNA synthetase beta chain
MKVSLQWINDYVEHKLKADELVHRLTMAGLEVEHVEDLGYTKVFEIEVTPNRPDCLNTIGIAREIAAICQAPLKIPAIKEHGSTKDKVSITIDDREDCGRYIATVIKGVRVEESPKWLKERIEALGMRPINNIVDITNFCLMELGQPLHAFDYDKLIGKKIIVRRARRGEEIKILDGTTKKVDDNILVIADEKRPVAIAGIMGGEDTQITSATKDILLESAHFSLGLVRKATRSLGLSSDSAYRFERGVNWDTIERGADRAVDLILKLAGGTVEVRTDVTTHKPKTQKTAIAISQKEIEALLGTKLPLSKCKAILTKLDFDVKASGKDALRVTPPSFRGDIHQAVDIIEEVARIIGFDNLPMTQPLIKALNITPDPTRRAKKNAMYERLIAQGYNEIITISMTNQKSLEKSALNINAPLKIVNPLSGDQEFMRPSLLPSFLSVTASNLNHGEKNLRFFEFGRVYLNGVERETLGILTTGQRYDDWRINKKDQVDFYDLKGAVEAALEPIGLRNISFEATREQGFDAEKAAAIRHNGKVLGTLGRVSSEALQRWDIKAQNVFFAQINIEEATAAMTTSARFEPINDYPSVVRDVSLAVKQGVTFDQVKVICLSLGGENLRSVHFLEEYVGEKIQPGFRGIVFSLVYQSSKGTLKEHEVSQAHDAICQALVGQLGAIRR